MDAPEVLDAAEGIFDQMAFSVALSVIDDPSFPVDASRNDRNDAALAQFLPDCVGVVALVSEQPSCSGQSVEE